MRCQLDCVQFSVRGTMNVSLLYSSYVEGSYIGIQQEEVNLNVLHSLSYVMRHVFAQLSSTLVIMSATRSTQLETWFRHLLSELIGSWSYDVAVQMLYINGTAHRQHVPGRKYCNLILTDSYASLRETRITEDNAAYDSPEYYFIFLQKPDVLIPHELQLIIEHCLEHYWLNCNVMVQTAQGEILIYSYYPYREHHCQVAKPELVNRFDGIRMIHEPMFPNKLNQLHQCPLSLLLWHMPPYVQLGWNDHTSQLLTSGFEVLLVNHLAQRLNFSIVLHNLTLLHVDKYKLTWAKNGTVDGPIELLMQRRFNLSIGYFRKTARRDQLLTSVPPHFYAPLVAIVGKEHFRFGRMTLLTLPFHWLVWSTLLAALLLHFIIYLCRWRGICGQVLELLLGVALTRLPRCWMQRLIYIHWLFGTIPLRIVYQALLFHIMRLQLTRTMPSSFEQLLDSGFKGLCTSNTWQIMQDMPLLARSYNYESFRDVASSYDQDVLDALHLSDGRRVFAITDLDTSRVYLRDEKRQESYHILTQYVNLQQLSIYMPKHSYFYRQFMHLIRRLDAGGFIVFWHRFSIKHYGTQRLQLQHKQTRSIHESQLSAIFILMGALYLLASLIFCAELLFHRLSNQPIESY